MRWGDDGEWWWRLDKAVAMADGGAPMMVFTAKGKKSAEKEENVEEGDGRSRERGNGGSKERERVKPVK
ncbi:hypothetical protein NL676_034353 [Syzygium grande]|nr:hypothetical protein NL676_034353 [Syzygium grande]